MRARTFLCLLLALVAPSPLLAQATGRITGMVTGEQAQPIAGAQVSVPGTQLGTITGADGRFVIVNVPTGQQRVRALFVGYAPAERMVTVAANEAANVSLQMAPQAVALEEIIATGRGGQQRLTSTGSVATVQSDRLADRPVGRITEALQGAAPGLTVIQRSGQPGRQDIQFNIRGRGTLGNTTPLVLIDGIPGDINQIPADQIENVAILKDASTAAIYGARAANGVVLVTTKRGSNLGGVRMSYDGYYGIQGVAHFPKHVDVETYMRLINEAYRNGGFPEKYTEEYIQNTLRGTDPVRYPVTDWLGTLFDPAPIQDHTFTMTGGNELARFNLSLNYFDQQGMTPQTFEDRYALRLNSDFNITSRLQTGVDVALRRTSDQEPFQMGEALFRMFHDTPMTIMPKYADGTYGWSDNGHNPLAYMEAYGTRDRRYTHGLINAKADYQLVPGLALRTQGSVQGGSWRYADWRMDRQFRDYWNPEQVRKSVGPNQLDRREATDYETYLRGMLDFNRNFGSHNLQALLGYDQTASDREEIRAIRRRFHTNDLREINLGDASDQSTFGTSHQWRLRSGFGRVAYNWQDKYMLEANGRYDGSSRFAEGNRFGFFPSFSAAWRISEEPFFNVGLVNDLKLRGSWGRMGNQSVRRGNAEWYYPYHSTISLGHNYVFGSGLVTGAAQTQLANRDITWETTTMQNVGLDAEFLGGRLSVSGDVYRKDTHGILLTLPIPNLVGLAAPAQNAGKVRNTGWETSLNWRDRVGGVNYQLGLNFSDNRNQVLDLAGTGPYIDGLWITQEGLPLGTMWGYQSAGLFVNQADVDNHAEQHPWTKPGDIKFVDQNGDGIINADDRVAIGNDLPRYLLGSTMGASYRGFDANLFFQGVLKVDAFLTGALVEGPFWENFTTHAWLDRWTEENPNPNAKMPRPALRQWHNHAAADFWVRDGSYVKLKSAQFGYTLPDRMGQRLGLPISGMRVYVSGQNLLTFAREELILDPEFPSGRATVYPQTRTVSIGTNVQF